MPTTLQTIFMVFYAILWGVVANAQPKWRAFNWPVAGTYSRPRRRVALAILVLNVAPILYFLGVFFLLRHVCVDERLVEIPGLRILPIRAIAQVFLAVVPANAPFALYRIWIALLERNPDTYYYRAADPNNRPSSVEPINDPTGREGPALFPRWWRRNFLTGALHLAVCIVAAVALYAGGWWRGGLVCVILLFLAVVVVWGFRAAQDHETTTDRAAALLDAF